jgi:hypothetical protein
MNRHERRAARKRAAKMSETYFRSHLPFLERAPLGQLERGRVYHTIFRHDDWCGYFKGDECNCSPTIERLVEPRKA